MPGYNLAALQSLANAQGLQKPANLEKLKRLSETDVPNFVSEADQQKSETYLLHRQATKSIKKPLMRTKRKPESYQHQNITKELVDRVQCNEGAAVVQVLWNKESQASSVKSEEKRVSEIEERDLLLGKAVQHRNLNTVWILASKTSQVRRDEALSIAMSLRDHAIIRKLLEYRANANHGHQHFTTAVAAADVATVELILQALPTGALHNQTLVDVLLLAVKNHSTVVLWRIVSSADLNNIPDHPAVDEATQQGRIDMLLVLLLSIQDLNSEFLGNLPLRVFNPPLLDSYSLDRTLHALLSAGAKGNGVASAFRLAIEKQSLPFIKPFAQYMVDVNWGEGRLVRCAVETMRPDILCLVLSSCPLSPENASRAVTALPEKRQN